MKLRALVFGWLLGILLASVARQAEGAGSDARVALMATPPTRPRLSRTRSTTRAMGRALSPEDHQRIRALGTDLKRVWSAPSTTDRDKKELLRTLLEESDHFRAA